MRRHAPPRSYSPSWNPPPPQGWSNCGGPPQPMDSPGLAYQAALRGENDSHPWGVPPLDQQEEIPESKRGLRLEAKCIDMIFDPVTLAYNEYERAENDNTFANMRRDKYAEFAFTLHRTIEQKNDPHPRAYFDIRSPFLREAFKEVIGAVEGVSWTTQPLRVDHKTFLMFLPELQAHSELLTSRVKTGAEDDDTLTAATHLTFFVTYLRAEYADMLRELAALLEHGEITFDLLWAILRPRTVLFSQANPSAPPRAVRLLDASQVTNPDLQWQLRVEYVDSNAPVASNSNSSASVTTPPTSALAPKFGLAVGTTFACPITVFKGAKKITNLRTYPLVYHAQINEITRTLVERGKKWASLQGCLSHVQYVGRGMVLGRFAESMINGRVMIDRESFDAEARQDNVPLPSISKTLKGEGLGDVAASISPFDSQDQGLVALDDDNLLLTNPSVYGYSFPDKNWVTFDVSRISPIVWSDEPFENLILSGNQKALVKALVEAYNVEGRGSEFDDFVQGKGQGLVINLFGNPGVGKTLTAEATSEHAKRPLCVVGAADLGTFAESVETQLTSVFKLSERWGAIVLIDEADVFLEERSLHDIARNAMVAVFLRHLEYFRGILFLTTNRIYTFDAAFQSRIHVSLRYPDLDFETKRRIWTAFIEKANGRPFGSEQASGVSEKELAQLAERPINGRQIKNAVRTASALARSANESLAFGHLDQVLEMMADFMNDFSEMRK